MFKIFLKSLALRKIIAIIIICSLNLAFSAEPDNHGAEGVIRIGAAMAKKVGIKTQFVKSGVIQTTLTVYGGIVNDPNHTSHLRARFQGVVVSTKVDLGDVVQAGDVIVEIESNVSLSNYAIKSPIDGIVTARDAEVGELAQGQILFIIESFHQLWAELQIFPDQMTIVKVGQEVYISANNQQIKAVISHLIPNQQNQPFIYARVKIDNSNNQWAPGMFVKGEIATNLIEAGLVIDNRALQTLEGKNVVFVKDGNEYEAHVLKLGSRDQQFSEVLDGLNAGDEYVVENSYLIKADVEKSNASHDD